MTAPTPAERVSVLIVNYNAGAGLALCVRSTLSQADEVIVVDNASHDDSMQAIRELANEDARLVIIANSSNLGFARACNIAAAASHGDYLLFLNPDCVLAPDAVAGLVAAMQADTGAGMAGGLLLNADGTEQAGGRRLVPTPWRTFVRAFGLRSLADRYPRLFNGYDLHRQPLPKEPVAIEAISGACMMVRREAMCDVGLLDEGYFMHCEDLDWCMRFRQRGWRVLFVPSARVTHFKGVCSRARPVFVEWHKHCGMVRFYRRFFRHQYPGVLMWAVMLAVWLRFAAVSCVHLARKWFRIRPA
ncbi:glycosyltransferase family 2 protein [Viridibacterium curvum]|uniref:Glycosyltransferase family 2 protein n=2 Tax=Viridibacterium curvum TaxID=1101404 RepID=A0ABP9QLB6_9RHOO